MCWGLGGSPVPARGGGSGSDLRQGLVTELLFGESRQGVGVGVEVGGEGLIREGGAGKTGMCWSSLLSRGKLGSREVTSRRAVRLGPHLPRHIPPGLS